MADKTMVDYTQKIKPYFEGIAPIEPTTTATSAHAVEDIFYLNGELVVATSAIAIGDTIVKTEGSTVGNCEDADDIVTQIKNHTVTTDAVPTEGSTNPVQSNGVYVANQNIYKVMGENGAKNILPFDIDAIKALNTAGTWAGNVYTYRGVDFTVNSDGTILADGQATDGNASIKIFAATSSYEMLGKNVILNGCPSGGSATTYRIQAYRMGSVDGSTGTYFDDGEGTIAFDALNDASGTVGSFAVAVYENYDADNLLFKPMVRLATDSDDTYQPYAKTNKELTGEIKKAYQTDDVAETAIADNDYIPFYDTSATAKRKSLWSNIKAVFKAYFDTLYGAKPVIKTATLAVGSTDVTFTNLPTTGDWFVSCHTSDPNVDYESVDNSTAGTLVYTFAEQESALTVYLRLEKVEV